MQFLLSYQLMLFSKLNCPNLTALTAYMLIRLVTYKSEPVGRIEGRNARAGVAHRARSLRKDIYVRSWIESKQFCRFVVVAPIARNMGRHEFRASRQVSACAARADLVY